MRIRVVKCATVGYQLQYSVVPFIWFNLQVLQPRKSATERTTYIKSSSFKCKHKAIEYACMEMESIKRNRIKVKPKDQVIWKSDSI